jgi:hypothetical protein
MQELLERLGKAKFSGSLDIHFDRGQIVSAELRHMLANTEFAEPITTVENEADTSTSTTPRLCLCVDPARVFPCNAPAKVRLSRYNQRNRK